MRHPLLAGLALLGLVVFLVGCGGPKGREKVSGKITFRGAPLDQGSIQFHPQDTAAGGSFEGATVKNGKYEVPARQGLLPGKYKVVISSPEPAGSAEPVPGEAGPPAEDRIPAEFGSNSTQVVEVVKGRPNIFNFDIP
jgi:hypothetical protein